MTTHTFDSDLRHAELSLNSVALTQTVSEFRQTYKTMTSTQARTAWVACFSGWLCSALESGNLTDDDETELLALSDAMIDYYG